MMRTARRIWNRLLGSLSGHPADTALAEEIEAHIQLMADESIRRGVPPEEAYRRARLRFGSVDAATERYRDQRGLPALDTLAQDLRYALRGIRRNPGFAVVAILSLGIGIGANTAIFSLVNRVLLQPLAFNDPQRVYAAREIDPRTPGRQPIAVNPAHALAWGADCPSIEQVALMSSTRADVTSGGEPVSIRSLDVPHNFFPLLGVEPIIGRGFLPEEEQEGNHRVAILLESFWRSRFKADPSLLHRTIVIDRQNYQVVGIVPEWFRAPFGPSSFGAQPFEIFRPLVLSQEERSRLTGNHNYAAVVRVRQGASVDQAVAEMDAVLARIPRNAMRGVLIPAHQLVTGRARLGLWMLAAAVGAVLLIVCLNLANLLLSRIASRSREAAIRTALGASRGRQFRMVLTESLLLAICGGALGILFANWLVDLLVTMTTLNIPRLAEVRLDVSVLGFACCLTLLAGILFGVLPAWRLSRGNPQDALRSGSRSVTEGRGGLRLRESLISIEVGLSATLLIVAGLLTATLTRLTQVDKGFDPGHVLTVDFSLSGTVYEKDADRERFFERLLTRTGVIPGVVASALITELPTRGETWNDPIYLQGGKRFTVNNRYASPDYFRVMEIAVQSGRPFDERDRGRGVAVLSEKAAKLLWPEESNPVGRSFMGEDDKIKTLVGIVRDVRASLESEPPPTANYPYWQRVPAGGALVVRTSGDPQTAMRSLRTVLRSEDPQLPIRAIQTMEGLIGGSLAERRFQSILVTVFAGSALLVASLGIYGIVSYSVARRRNEIGIRMALGAQRSQLLGLVVRQGMAPVALGLAGGIAAAILVGRAIRGLLFGVQPADPATMAAVAVILLAVGFAACLIPAGRAARTDPVSALRIE
jgi:putative ABC transport system permease protein